MITGLFTQASDARRALDLLREHRFTAQETEAAFREKERSVTDSGAWFGQLRDIYRGDVRAQADPNPGEFNQTLSQLHLSPQDQEDARRSEAVVSVTAGGRDQEARALLEQCGARILDTHIVDRGSQTPVPAVQSTPFIAPKPADPGHIQLYGEVLHVHKEKVSSGDVRVRKEAVTHMETVQVPVTREHLVVEHPDGSGHENAESAIRIPLSEERVHVDKDTVLREEFKVGKREITQNQSLTEPVRRERLLIDDANGAKSV